MNLDERIKSFALLGEILNNAVFGKSGIHEDQLIELINRQYIHNPWFTPESVKEAIGAIAGKLTYENLVTWMNHYPEIIRDDFPLTVGVIMAGNIPLVGFHDFLSVLISGNKIIAKTSSKDTELIAYVGKILCSLNPGFIDKIEFTGENIKNFDVIIATGSDNSSRYFGYYFGKYPNIIRKNRNSLAIIDGTESDLELENLGKDIFSYFGLGCRNVSKVFLPKGSDIKKLSGKWDKFSGIIGHEKYANNYDFSKAVFIVNKEPFYDCGYLLMKEDSSLSSPVAVLHYEFYDSQATVIQQIEQNKEKIQCVVGRNHIPFGNAQSPDLWDYADGADTIDFLLKKKLAGIL